MASAADTAAVQPSTDSLEDAIDSLIDPFLKKLPKKEEPKPEPAVQPPVEPPPVVVVPPPEPPKPEPPPIVQPPKEEEKVVFPALNLTGIIYNTVNPQAIINNNVVSVGSQIEGVEVTAIDKNGVQVTSKGQSTTVRIK